MFTFWLEIEELRSRLSKQTNWIVSTSLLLVLRVRRFSLFDFPAALLGVCFSLDFRFVFVRFYCQKTIENILRIIQLCASRTDAQKLENFKLSLRQQCERMYVCSVCGVYTQINKRKVACLFLPLSLSVTPTTRLCLVYQLGTHRSIEPIGKCICNAFTIFLLI